MLNSDGGFFHKTYVLLNDFRLGKRGMLKKTFIGVIFAVFVSGLLIAGINFNATKAVDYGSSGTYVGGYITTNTTWTLAGSPYIVVADVIVEPNVFLTIEPGVIVKFAIGTNLVIDGGLFAWGNSTHKITFTSNNTTPTPGDWGTIKFRSPRFESVIEWGVINYGTDGVLVASGSPTIVKCSIAYNQRFGIYVSAGTPTIINSTISNNDQDGIWNYVGAIAIMNTTVTNNGGNGIYKDSGSITITGSTISNNRQSGIYGGAGGGISIVDSTITYNGHNGITIVYSDVLANQCRISYNNVDGICMSSGTLSGSATITYSIISHNSRNGVYKDSGSMRISFNNITSNQVGVATTPFKKVFDSFQEKSGDTIIEYNNIFDNILYAVENIGSGVNTRGDEIHINATYNWWGTTNETLIEEHIYDYYDDYNLGKVLYKPYLIPPIANFTYSPHTPFVYQTVTFNASVSFNPYGSITSYAWDFGDDTTTIVTSPIVTHTYTEPGNYNVTLSVTDEYGLMNNTTTSLAVLPDNVSPVTVNDYDGLWHIADFIITLTATDHESGVAETYYRINDGPVKVVSVDGQPLITTEGVNNTLEYWSVDNAGNEELPHKILTGIKLDKTAPTSSITINDDATYTTTTSVTLTLSATDATSGIAEMRFSNDNTTYTEWQTYATFEPWILQDGDGAKTVYVQFRDHAGLISTYSDTIALDTTPPTGSVTIAGGAAYTNSPSITLTLSATDAASGVAQMRFSHDGIEWSNWESYSTSKSWTLTTGDGTKMVYIQFKDNAGLISPVYPDTIILDITIPNIGIPSREPTDDIFPAQPVKISVNITDATSNVKNATLYYSLNNGTTWEEPIPMNYNTSTGIYEATIPPQPAGTWVRFKIVAYDYAGNNATLDGTEPYCVYQVIPEFPSFLILPLFMMATLIAAILLKKKRKTKSQPLFC
jgi:PKD repeat protein